MNRDHRNPNDQPDQDIGRSVPAFPLVARRRTLVRVGAVLSVVGILILFPKLWPTFVLIKVSSYETQNNFWLQRVDRALSDRLLDRLSDERATPLMRPYSITDAEWIRVLQATLSERMRHGVLLRSCVTSDGKTGILVDLGEFLCLPLGVELRVTDSNGMIVFSDVGSAGFRMWTLHSDWYLNPCYKTSDMHFTVSLIQRETAEQTSQTLFERSCTVDAGAFP